jgi:hypothetical protein
VLFAVLACLDESRLFKSKALRAAVLQIALLEYNMKCTAHAFQALSLPYACAFLTE